jgi:hypothetical protein
MTRKELKVWLEKERDRSALAERMPQLIELFLGAFCWRESTLQKAQLIDRP